MNDSWASCSTPNPQARLRLFCFPYAGAGSSMFNRWFNGVPNVELYLVHLPGRDRRIREPLHDRLFPLVDYLTEGLLPYLDKPFAFFGHSMGGLLSFEVARQLRRLHAPQPMRLFISARRPPQKHDPHTHLYQLPGNEFLKATEDLYGALPEVIKQDPEMLKLFLTIMRADLTILGTYQYVEESPLDCSISVYGGLQDKSVAPDELEDWRALTSSSFARTMFPGDHYYIQNARTAVVQQLALDCSGY
jgi:medium-chain acyl-[acyl-carrier-protein] hydrolase